MSARVHVAPIRSGNVQVFFPDPDGAEIELIFYGDEAAADIAAGVGVDATAGRDTAPGA